MSVTREELLRAAYASTDDTDRLVYADWLEQHGEVAHAQVVHMQCERARTDAYDRRRIELQWELDAAQAELGTRWADHLPVIDGVTWHALDRGLPGTVRVRDVETLIEHADAIIAAAPSVSRVVLDRCEVARKQKKAAIPWLRTLRVEGAMSTANPILQIPRELELDVGEYEEIELDRPAAEPLERLVIENNATIDNDLAHALADDAWTKPLRVLHIPTSRADEQQVQTYYGADPRIEMDAEGAERIATLESLESLVIDRHALTTAAVEGLLAVPKLRELSAREVGLAKVQLRAKGESLDALDLSQNSIRNAGAQAIAQAQRTRALKRLVLDTCDIEGAGLAALIASPMWKTLRYLDLSRNALGISGARALAEAPAPEHLHTLLLADADFDEASANALAKVGWLGGLLQLDLSGNMLGNGAMALRAMEPTGLRRVVLASIGMGRTEAALVARLWAKCVHLELGGNPIGDAGIERFAMREAAALQTLRLDACQLTDDGLEMLAAAKCPRLRSLDLRGNAFGAKGIAALFAAPMMKRVAALDLSKCELDLAAIETIARTPPPPGLARIDLRENDLDEAKLVTLAESKTLRPIELRLDGNPFVMPGHVREALEQRFGAGWFGR